MSQTTSLVLKFTAKVTETDGKIARGAYEGALTENGLTLSRKGNVIVQIPQRAQRELLKRSSVRITFPNHSFVFQVVKATGYVEKIAQAIVSFPLGEMNSFDPRDYEFPKWLLGVAVVPLVLIPFGGVIGGALGGAAAGINFVFARREKLPIPLRALAMLGTGMIGVCCYLAIVLIAFGGGSKSPNAMLARSVVQPNQGSLASASPPRPENFPPPVSATYKQFLEKGQIAIPYEVPDPLSASPGQPSESIIVGHRDGSLRSYSLSQADHGWQTITRLPGPVEGLQNLSSGYWIAHSGRSNFLVDPSAHIFRLPYRWVSIAQSNDLMALHQGELILGDLSYSGLEELANAQSNKSDHAIIDFPPSAIQSKASLTGVKFSFDGNEEEILCLGRGSVSVGYRSGKSQIWASGTWIDGDFRSVGVTVVGTRCGTGYADGLVDTGRVGPGRYKQCGNQPIVSLIEIQAWHVALNAGGEVWAWTPHANDAPRRIALNESEPVRAIVSLSSSTAVVGARAITFYDAPSMSALLK